jgi:hypothetical protein
VAGLSDLPTRELFNQWLRALTVLTEPGDRPMPERLALIAEVNQVRAVRLEITYPLSIEDADKLAEALHLANRLRSRETGTRALVTSLLLRWLSDATGQPQSDIITRLTVTIDATVPPDEPAPADPNHCPI